MEEPRTREHRTGKQEHEPLPNRTSSKSLSSVTVPVPLECPVCHASCTSKGKPFLEVKQLKGHWMGKRGRDGHTGLFDEQAFVKEPIEETPSIPQTPQREPPIVKAKPYEAKEEPVKPVKPIVDEVYEEEPEELVERPLEEPLPTELDYLNTLLLEHGVRKRAVVLRALDLREPTNFYVLVDALTDVGVNRSRQRRICEDYSAWMGKAIPQDIVEELSPDDEGDYRQPRSSRWSRRGEGRRGQGGRSELEGVAEVFREVGAIYERARPKETFQHRDDDTYKTLYEEEKSKNEELRQQLTDEKIESLRNEFDAKIATQDDGVKMAITKLETPVKRVGDILEKIVGGALEMEFPKKPPKRKKLGEPTILEMAPEEMIEG